MFLKGNKYGNKKQTYKGIKFDSKKELERYRELELKLKAGSISNLQRQVVIPIVVNGVKVCYMRLDHVYYDNTRNETVYEDVKGFNKKTGKFLSTSDWKLKKKLMWVVNGINIVEV